MFVFLAMQYFIEVKPIIIFTVYVFARLRVKGLSYVPPEQKEALMVDKAVRLCDVQHGAAEDNVNVEGIINFSTMHLFIYLLTQTSLMLVNPSLAYTCF